MALYLALAEDYKKSSIFYISKKELTSQEHTPAGSQTTSIRPGLY